MPIFRIKSVKIYTGQKNLHWRRQWRQWQLSGMPQYSICYRAQIYPFSQNYSDCLPNVCYSNWRKNSDNLNELIKSESVGGSDRKEKNEIVISIFFFNAYIFLCTKLMCSYRGKYPGIMYCKWKSVRPDIEIDLLVLWQIA